MNKKRLGLALGTVFALNAVSLSVQAAQWGVTITNLTHGNLFTPLLVTASDHDSHLFQVGSAASAGLTSMAECGDLSGLLVVGEAGLADADTIADPAGGLLAAGLSTTTTLNTIDATSTHLSIVAMVLPSNDAFVGMDSQHIPAEAGSYTYYLNAYDAGTEANNELIAAGCTAGMPGMPGGTSDTGGTGAAGADSNTNIHIHRGVLGDTDNAGGVSDNDSRIHRWQNPVAKVVVTVTP